MNLTVKLSGGLGNQMTQYALALALAKRHSCTVCLDTSFFLEPDTGYCRIVSLNHFNIRSDFAFSPHLTRFSIGWKARLAHLCRRVMYRYGGWIDVREQGYRYDPSIGAELQPGLCYYFDGYWQSERYFAHLKDDLRRDFTPRQPSPELERQMNLIRASKCSVAIHVRRGDYVSNLAATAVHGVMTPEYYFEAVEMINNSFPDAHYFVFSDDLDWCRAHLQMDRVHFVSGNQNFEDLILMSKCHHFIIANSTFSWWAAWLGELPESLVICPKKWHTTIESDIQPERWLKI